MNILKLIIKHHQLQFWMMLILTVCSGVFGIAVLAFINHYLLHSQHMHDAIIWQFILLLIAYFAFSVFAQVALAKIGQGFIYDLRIQLIKRILDTNVLQLEKVGKAKILSSLSSDIRSISMAFTSLPNVAQGVLFFLGCCVYLAYLSLPLFLVTLLWLIVMIVGSYPAMRRTHQNFKAMRKTNDVLYKNYDEFLSGHKELSLNRKRAQNYYDSKYLESADKNRNYHVQADKWSAITNNWNNVLMLAAVGCIFYLCAYLNWASITDAATFAMAILFMRQPLLSAIGVFPLILQSQVAFNALQSLNLADYQKDFHYPDLLPRNWKTIQLHDLTFTHPEQSGQTFSLAPINLTLHKGETVFLIGANGSGKSTLSMLLTGLYEASNGYITVDDIIITPDNRTAYCQLFTAVFTEFYLFKELFDNQGNPADDHLIERWLNKMELQDKAIIKNSVIANSNLSQGQKKRLALLSALVEQHSVIVLDEWAADQDPYFRKIFYEQLLPIFKAQGFTIFAISHDDKYFALADRILEMQNGVLHEHNAHSAQSRIQEFNDQPNHKH